MAQHSWALELRKYLGGVWRGLDELTQKTSGYIICFGFLRGSILLALGAMRAYPNGKMVRAAVPGSAVRLLVRLGTSDINVFNCTFHGHENEWDFLEPPKTIVDAGAYTGLSTAFFAMRYPDAQVIAIEPGPENFALLTRNVRAFKNVHAIQAALWSERGSLMLTDPGLGFWGLRVTEPPPTAGHLDQAGPQAVAPPVRALTMRDVMHEYGLDRVHLLKLDIEGSEKEVFANAGPWIGDVDAICIELHDRYRPGCSRAFFGAVTDFPIELRRGEKLLVVRDGSAMSHLRSRNGPR